MFRRLTLIVLTLLAAVPATAAFRQSCPAADTVVAHPIPFSVNSVFTAKSGDLEFWAYDAGWLAQEPLYYAAVTAQDGSFGLQCTYGSSTWHETLLSDDSQALRYCWFPQNHSQSCYGSLTDCTLECLFQPEPDPTSEDVKKRSIRPKK